MVLRGGREEANWVKKFAILTNGEVQMRPRRQTGIAGACDGFAACYGFTHVGESFAEMGIHNFVSIGYGVCECKPVCTRVNNLGHYAICDSESGCADVRREVDAVMQHLVCV